MEVEPSHSSQHLSEGSVNTPHHDPNVLHSSNRIPVDTHILSEVSKGDLAVPVHEHILSEVSKVEFATLDGEPSVSSPKKSIGVKRARSPEDESSASGRPTKKQDTGRLKTNG